MRYAKDQDIVIDDDIEFTEDMLQLSPDAPRREYYSRKKEGEIKKMVHWGQRKLLISEIEFLVYFWDPKTVPNPIIVYAGAACGDHIPILSMLFPQIKELHLYDPAPFSISATNTIHIYQRLFTEDDARNWSNRDDVLFISDIRTGDYTKMTSDDNERAIIRDMELQRVWVEIIQPVQAHLKFRLPYSDFDKDYMKLQYFDGHVLLQPWAPHTSTETRLIPRKGKDGYKMRDWNAIVYEEQLFYHNTVYRSHQLYKNPFNNNSPERRKRKKNPYIPIHYPELSNDYDSLAEVCILQAYFRKFGRKITQQDICKLSDRLTKELNRYGSQEKTIDRLRNKSIHEQRKQIKKIRYRKCMLEK